MLAAVFAHIDELGSLPDSQECGLRYRLRLADKGDYGPVSGFSGIHIQEFNPFDAFDQVGDLFDNTQVAPFGEIGYALDQLFHIPVKNCQHPRLQNSPLPKE